MENLFKELEAIPFSKDLYISGNRALNINDPIHHTGDWHTVEIWNPNAKLKDFHIMGKQSPALLNTNLYLGTDGVFDATHLLLEMGIPKFNDVVYASTHARAIADQVIAEAFFAKPLNGSKLFRFISLYDFDDYMPESTDKDRVYTLLEKAVLRLPEEQSLHVKAWLNKAKLKNYE